jgi:UDP:flavonoid glycosyltransferase YjiC (YdhE family)
MNILVASLPLSGHVLPMRSVVRELLRRGHQVTWATWESAQSFVNATGATWLPIPGTLDLTPAPLMEWIHRLRDGIDRQCADFGTTTFDVVLADPTVAGVCRWSYQTRTPHHVLGLIPFLGVPRGVWRLYQTTIPDFEPWTRWQGAPILFTGPVPIASEWEPPSWWTERVPGPHVVLTQGTLANDPSLLICPALTALHDLPLLPIVTAPPDQTGVITGDAWVPLPAVLPGASLLITNGGYGGIQAAITAGVPVLVAGDLQDNTINGGNVEYAGIGRYLGPPYTAERIRDAILEILNTPRYADRARELQARIPPKPAVEIIVDSLTGADAAERMVA